MDGEISKVKSWKIFLPALIGLTVIGFMFFREFDPAVFNLIDSFCWMSVFWIFMAILCIVGRDLGYVVRLRVLSENQLSWIQSFRIIMLWEFTSAITPSSVGGTSVALLYVHKEGLSLGKSTSIVMVTSLLDEIYFVLMFPLLVWIVGSTELFNVEDSPGWTNGMFLIAIIGFAIKFVWVLLLIYGLFFNPRGFGKLIFKIFSLPILKRWRKGAVKTAQDIEQSSTELKAKKISFWIKSFLSTFVSWTSRYWIVNCLFLAFFAVHDHLLIFARQLVMWIALLVTPTPGGSGVAEYMFDKFLGGFIPLEYVGFSVVLALIWRLVSYYPYLIIGAIMVPKWVSDKFAGKNE